MVATASWAAAAAVASGLGRADSTTTFTTLLPEVGDLAIGLVVAYVGYKLNRKTNDQNHQLNQIQVNVDGRLSDALTRVLNLETKLSLTPGEPIPDEAVMGVATVAVPPSTSSGTPTIVAAPPPPSGS